MRKTHSPTPPLSRRREYAEATRQAIIDSARKLFAQQGFFSTSVEAIAAEARVAPATVYAATGGKQGLLRALVDQWSSNPAISATLIGVEQLEDSREAIRLVAATCCSMRREHGDVIRVIRSTAPHDEAIAAMLSGATALYRKAILRIARQLVRLGELRAGIDLNMAADILWFYFGYAALFTLLDENGWSWDRSENWLFEAACRALLRDSSS